MQKARNFELLLWATPSGENEEPSKEQKYLSENKSFNFEPKARGFKLYAIHSFKRQ